MKPDKASPKTTQLHKFRALGLAFLLSAAMICGLFLVLVSPTQARERSSIENADAASGIEATVEQSALPLLDESDSLMVDWENYTNFGEFVRFTAVTVRNDNEIWFAGNVASSGSGSLQTAHYSYTNDSWATEYIIDDSSGPSEIRSIAFDENDDLLLATDDGVLKQTSGTGTPQAFGDSYLVDDVRALVVDGSEIWFGTFGGGAVHYTPGTPDTWETYTYTQTITDTTQICSNNIYGIAIQDNGNIWFGTDDGFCKLDITAEPDEWTYYLNGSDVDVHDLAIDAAGNVWAVRPGFGISILSPLEAWTHYTETNSYLTNVGSLWSITIDSTQRKWIGTQGYGVDVISPNNQDWMNFNKDVEGNEIADDIVNGIAEATNEDIWLAIEPITTTYELASQGTTAISGLSATNDSPTLEDTTTTLTATVIYGSGVVYTWNFGDGAAQAVGAVVTHTYQTEGNYTAVVTASNKVNLVTATTTVVVTPEPADLVVGKSGPDEIAAGALIPYEITVANRGVSPATDIVLTDTLPVSATFVTQTSSFPFTYNPTTKEVAWSIDFLAGGVTETFTLQAQVALSAFGSLTNTLVGIMAANDPTPVDNQATHTATVLPPIPGSDLFVSKSGPAQVPAGFPLAYAVTIANQGGQPATGVVVTDTLPDDISFVSSSHPTWNTTYYSDTNTVVWAIGTLAPGQSHNITLQTQVALTASLGARTNQITGTLNETDANTSNNQASHQTQILAPAPYLSITPVTNGANPFVLPVLAGGPPATMVITVTNTGTGPLNGGLSVSAVDYPWLTVSPAAITATIGVNELVTFTVSVTDTNQALGDYYDLMLFNSPSYQTRPFFLKVYVHPDLVTFTVPISNNLGQNVPGALVSFVKTVTRVISVDGGPGPGSISPYFAASATADSQGVATMSQVEVGTYNYTVSAANHRPVTGTFVVTSSTTQFTPPPLLALPDLVFEPAQANTSVMAGDSAHLALKVRNLGPGHATNFSITTPANLPWLSSGLPYSVTELLAGEAMTVNIFLNPPADTPSTSYTGNQIVVSADWIGSPAVLSITVNVVTTNTGELVLQVFDDDNLPLPDANVTLISQIPRIVEGSNGPTEIYDWQTVTTDVAGQITVTELTAGDYNYYIQADGYYNEIGATTVVPGPADNNLGINHQKVNLSADPFSYSWTVMETQITDTYALTLEITYEADAPALFISPEEICPPEEGGSYSDEWLIVNVGSITMTNLIITPDYPNFIFTVDTNNVPEELAPGIAINVPYTATSSNPAAQPWEGVVLLTSQYEFNGKIHESKTVGKITRCSYGDDEGGGGGSGWHWGVASGGAGIIGSGNSNSTPPLPSGAPPPPSGSGNEQAQLYLSGNAFLLRQAFRAFLEITSNTTDLLEDFAIDIEARDENGLAVINGFAVTPDLPTYLGSLSSPGQSLEAEWLLVPGELGITNINGEAYYLWAQIGYTHNGQAISTLTLRERVVIYPQPQVRLSFSHNQPDEDGNFYVEVTADNEGYGVARALTLDLNNIAVLDDLDGNYRSLLFNLKQTTIDGLPQETDYVFHFGNLQPGQSRTGRWLIEVGASDGAPLFDPIITGFKVGCKHLDYQGLETSALIIDCGEINQFYLNSDCPFCSIQDKNSQFGGPINTFNGNYDYSQSTPQVATVGNLLKFTWTYNSLNSGASPSMPPVSSTLGLGWSHNYDLRLDLSITDSVIFHSPRGNNYTFRRYQDTYQPAPGVWATLETMEVSPGQNVYTITARNQAQYIFDSAGYIIRQVDAHGNVLNYEYDLNGYLERIVDPVSQRYLKLTYDGNGRLSSVSDPISRTTQFGYNEVGHLTAVTDTRGLVWSYSYTQLAGSQYVLSEIVDPDGRIVEQTGFDNLGRATSQLFHGQIMTITYFSDGRRVIEDALGNETIHIYNNQGLLVATADPERELERFVFDGNQNRISVKDRNGNPTFYDKTALGYYTTITNSLGFTTYLDYDEHNNRILHMDGRGQTTYYSYDPTNNLITETNHLSDTIYYTYNEWGQMVSATDENENTTHYGFDELGQMVVITNALGQTTHFEYDAIGRLITTTDTMGRVTINQYDNGDNLTQVIVNYLAGQPQNYMDEYNLIMQYGYNDAGWITAITDTLGRINLTLYDDAGRVVTQVNNYDGATPLTELCTDFTQPDPEFNLCMLTAYDEVGRIVATTDSLGRVDRTIYDSRGWISGMVRNWSGTITNSAGLMDCLSLPPDRDYDICSLYAYDNVGNSIIMTDTMGRVTRTFYDSQNQIEGMILNWDGEMSLDDCFYLPVERDSNICMRYTYDETGNIIVVTDALGRLTHTFYDELGRTETIVANWNPATLDSPDDCTLSPENESEENVCTLYAYDVAGNQTVVTNALGQKSLIVYDSLNRPFLRVENWSGTPIDGVADCSFPPVEADTNLCTVTYYDTFGRPEMTEDPMGKLTYFGFDSQSRVVTTTQYLNGNPVSTTLIYNAVGMRTGYINAEEHTTTFIYDNLNRPVVTISPEGVAITQTYDAAGRVVSVTDNLGHTTINFYDGLDRPIMVVDAENNANSYEYDLLGNLVAMVDANSVRTTYIYDDLNRPVGVIENDTGGSQTSSSNLVTIYSYDALGNQTRVINARDITFTLTTYDDLNRPTLIVDALGNETAYQYNALSLRTVMTDANGAATLYNYDGLNRLVSATYVSDTQTVSYTYNAVGRLTAMIDNLGTTIYEYDELYRLITVTNPLTGSIGYGYDLTGNNNRLTYPDGRVVTYTYDGDNRLLRVDDWSTGVTSYTYDAAGRLVTTTLPNGVLAVNTYDGANRLVDLNYTRSDGNLLAAFNYRLDGVGNRIVVTETLPTPYSTVEAYLENNGLLVMEAEKGLGVPGSGGHNWLTQTIQSGFTGTAYLRVEPDVDQLYQVVNTAESPAQNFVFNISTPATYTLWIRGMATGAGGDSLYAGINDQIEETTMSLTGFTNEWEWSSLTMSSTAALLNLDSDGVYTLSLWMREDGLRVDRLLLTNDEGYIPASVGPVESTQGTVSVTAPITLTSQVIQFEYDNLNRLTGASYSGAITATYSYTYDAVGNMTAFTETIGVETKRVTRFFDTANRLIDAFDAESGTTVYSYDGNGNLIQITPPGTGLEGAQSYAYDQRNLLISNTVYITGTGWTKQAGFVYDGTGNRVQQVDYTAGQPITTTYVNSIIGLSQVLVANNGASQVYNVFGLSLIGQDDGARVRTLVPDSLGSIRVEMIDNSVETTTTYDPYGNQFAQIGPNDTSYGFTGEQTDDTTGLLYLRARYYNPALRSFMGRDPWSGDNSRPQSMNGWNYVESNPINRIDPSGMIPKEFPDYCRTEKSYQEYGNCVRQAYGIKLVPGDYENYIATLSEIPEPGCFEGPVPYRAGGYIEGFSGQVFVPILFGGLELVYDFATMEKQNFFYWASPQLTVSGIVNLTQGKPKILADIVGPLSVSASVGYLKGFRSWGNVTEEYSGAFDVASGQVDISGFTKIPLLTLTGSIFRGNPDTTIHGGSISIGFSTNFWTELVGLPKPTPIDISAYAAIYYPLGPRIPYQKTIQPGLVAADIMFGLRSPLTYVTAAVGAIAYLSGVGTIPAAAFTGAVFIARSIAAVQGYEWAQIYNAMHVDSYLTTSSMLRNEF